MLESKNLECITDETNMNNHSDMMELKYNDAQEKCLNFFHSLDSNTREVCVEMPTGTGKSFMMLDRLNTQKTNRCVLVFPRLTLLIQFRCAYLKKEVPLFYCSANDIDSSDEFHHEEEEKALVTIEKEKSRKDRKINENIILTTYISFPKLIEDEDYPNIQLTLFDEAHHNVSQRMKDLLMDPLKKEKCGTIYHFTATPVHINTINLNNGSHFVYTFEQAIRNHLIRSYNVYVVFHLKTSEENSNTTVLDEVAKITGDKFQRILAFTNYTKHEELPINRHNVIDVVPEWNNPDKGYNVVGLSSDNPLIDRKTIKRFEEFNEGKLSVLVSCRKLGEGIDIKNIDGIIFVDPKKKKKDIYQIIGRGLRLFRDSSGNPLDWSQQTPCNIIIDIAIDPPPSHPYLSFLKTGVLSQNVPELQALAFLSHYYNSDEQDYLKKAILEQYRLDFQQKLFDDLSNQISIKKSSFGIFESIINTITALKVNMKSHHRHQLDLKYEDCFDAEESFEPDSMDIDVESTTMNDRWNGMGGVKVKTQDDDEESVFAINTGFTVTDYEPVMNSKRISKHMKERTNVILDPLLKNIFKGSVALDELFKLLNGVNVEQIMDDNNKEIKNKKRSLESLESCSLVADDTSNGNMNEMKKQKTSLKSATKALDNKSEEEIKVV